MTDRLIIPLLIIAAVLAYALWPEPAGTTVYVTLTNLPTDCAPGQVAIATGSDDTYGWFCGDLE